jgi:hypothetical protein
LTAVDKAFGAAALGDNVDIGQLTWSNTPILSVLGPETFDAVWTLSVNLTIPTAESDSQAFDLHIVNTPNPASDQITLTVADLSNVSLTFDNGVVISNLDYVVKSNNGEFDESTNTWTNPEGKTSVLVVTGTVSAVPEPGTLILLGTGLAGVAAEAWRKRRRV